MANVRNLDVKVNDHIIRTEHLNATDMGACTTSFKHSSPKFYMFLHDRWSTIRNHTRGINKLGVGPVVFAIRGTVSAVPGVDEAINHRLSDGARIIVTSGSR